MSVAWDPTSPADGAVPAFPPLLSGVACKPEVDPFEKAVADAHAGRASVGDLYHAFDGQVLRAAVAFAPEEPLAKALPILFAAACGINDSLGSLAPPEVGVAHVWPDGIKVNGGWAGALRVEASTRDPAAVPDWIIVGLSVSMAWDPEGPDPGDAPYVTALSEEGCADISPVRLLESWSRHLLVWVNEWEDEGFAPIQRAWLDRADGRGEVISFTHGGRLVGGKFVGLDEEGNLLLALDGTHHAVPLAAVLDQPRQWPPEIVT